MGWGTRLIQTITMLSRVEEVGDGMRENQAYLDYNHVVQGGGGGGRDWGEPGLSRLLPCCPGWRRWGTGLRRTKVFERLFLLFSP